MLKQQEKADRPAGLSHRAPAGKRGPVAVALATATLFAGLLPPLHAHIASQPEAGKQRLAPLSGTGAAKSAGTLRQRLTANVEAAPIARSVLYFGLIPANVDQTVVVHSSDKTASTGSAPAAPQTSPSDEARNVTERWARAWSERDVDAYLAAYSKGFTPEKGIARSAWERARRQKIEGRKNITVSLRDLKIEVTADERMEVRFLQDYVADSFRESGTPKRLLLAREDGAWRIVGETTESAQFARK